MRLAPLFVALAVVAAARSARADGLYFTEGGGATHWKNQISAYNERSGHFHVALGYRHDRVALEVWGLGEIPDNLLHGSSLSALGLDAKWMFPLSRHVETYLRGSASRMEGSDALEGYAGRGLGFGAGVQIKGKAPLLAMLYPPIALLCLIPGDCKKLGPMGTIALWADTGYDFYRLHDPGRASIDAEATRWTIGFAMGSDF